MEEFLLLLAREKDITISPDQKKQALGQVFRDKESLARA